ncbi:MAG: hypothetical protein FJ104_09530, partial [Deltaproteobacteria bacterium]|nr:hypothetical protein [Deltaproteobacteria bacterium]
MPPTLPSPVAIGAAALVVAVTAATSTIPLFAGPGYESALAAGLVVPVSAAVATSVEVARSRPTPLGALGRGLVT